MKSYVFKKVDSGFLGKAFEMAIKDSLNRKNANRVSPCGSADFRYMRKNYEVKQNGSVLRYNPNSSYIKGSNRVIYATHISYEVITETAEEIEIIVDLADTELLLVDKTEFVDFLREINCIKENAGRGTVNIQTVYNYKKDAYHGRKGRLIEEWAYENALDDEDDIIGAILEGL